MLNVLVTYDVDGWAFHNRALALSKYAPEDVAVMITPWQRVLAADGFDPDFYDLCFNLDSSFTQRLCNCPHVLSWNADKNRRTERWQKTYDACDYMVFNNKLCWESRGRAARTCAISNGLDTDLFQVLSPIEERYERVFFTGSSNPLKKKGWDILNAASAKLIALGFHLDAHPVDSVSDKPFDTAGMAMSYNKAAYVLNLSESEATPNVLLEGMACGCAAVSTRCGNVLEFGIDGENCILIDRSVDGLIDGLLRARERRCEIATAGAELMRTTWAYGGEGRRANVFFWLVREMSAGRTPAPFAYDEDGPWRN